MKKLFAIIAVVMFAVAANADVLFQENFSTRRGSTYIAKVHLDSYDAWPYASQWLAGYTAGKEDEVTGNQFDNDYDAVTSYNCSVRGKQLDGSDKNTVGLFFSAKKAANQCYVKFEGALPKVSEGDLLKFQLSWTEDGGAAGAVTELAVKVNEAVLELPEITLGNKAITSEVAIALPEGQIDSLKFSFDNVPAQKFISKIWIESAAQGVENVVLTEKAQKVMIDGVMYIVRDEKLFDVRGTQVR